MHFRLVGSVTAPRYLIVNIFLRKIVVTFYKAHALRFLQIFATDSHHKRYLAKRRDLQSSTLRLLTFGTSVSQYSRTFCSFGTNAYMFRCIWIVKIKFALYSFFNLGDSSGGWLTPRPGRFTPWGKTRYPFCYAPGPVWTGAENLAPTWMRLPDRPSRGESLYRLSYPGSHR